MSKWKPIETAPKDGTPVDLWSTFGNYYFDISKRHVDMWFAKPLGVWRSNNGDICIRDGVPTHWMHIPTPPTDKT